MNPTRDIDDDSDDDEMGCIVVSLVLVLAVLLACAVWLAWKRYGV